MEPINHPKSNIASIFVALLSLGLIFFAVVLLNQTFTNRIGLATDEKSKSNSLSKKLDTNSSSSLSSVKIETTIGENQNSSQKPRDESRGVIKISNSPSSTVTSNKVLSSIQSSKSVAKDIETGEFIARYIGGDGTEENKNFQIISCPIKNPVRCKAGTEFYYSDYLKLKENYQYKFTNPKIEDTADKFTIESESLVEN